MLHNGLCYHRYLRSWFLIDLLSTIPVNTIIDLAEYTSPTPLAASAMLSCEYLETGAVSDVNVGVGSDLKGMQALRMVRLVRLLKLFRFLKLGMLVRRREDAVNINPAFLRLMRLLVVILFLSVTTLPLTMSNEPPPHLAPIAPALVQYERKHVPPVRL